MQEESHVYESFTDKAIKFVRLLSHIVWLIIGIITLMVTYQLYVAYQNGTLMESVQKIVPVPQIEVSDEQAKQIPAEYQQYIAN